MLSKTYCFARTRSCETELEYIVTPAYMGRREFQLSVHHKNEDRKRQLKKVNTEDASLVVAVPGGLITIPVVEISLSVSMYKGRHLIKFIDQLHSWLLTQNVRGVGEALLNQADMKSLLSRRIC